jgi:predicted GNAT family N-acyltransferase
MTTTVRIISSEEDFKKAFKIREEVFVIEQKVPREDEYDLFEKESVHFLAIIDNVPCGTCRWRYTSNGVKLERFAVLKTFRGKQVGSALVSACIVNIIENKDYTGQQLYLNAQMDAMPLYAKFGFQPVGDIFLECDIKHLKMVKTV